MPRTALEQLVQVVLPAAEEYFAAEEAASDTATGDVAVRKALALCVPMTKLIEISVEEFHLAPAKVRLLVQAGCCFPGGAERPGCIERIRAVAAAARHPALSDQSLPITSEDDVIFHGAGWGIDGFGIGKYGGLETLIREKSGQVFKFLGDVPCAVQGWSNFLSSQGVVMPGTVHKVCNLPVRI